MQQAEHFHQQRFPLDTTGSGFINQRHYALAVGLDHRFNQRQRLIVVKRTQHRTDRLG
ncbi:Uncharacterised protein [Escherichia coli]|uniref:Uncharacterized protein n=1 Tax=Escherichia coli TaxID=562 RepID=A0A2X1N1K1_ECOLX|nr:Uncharacterised protein [Escherichia coli]